MKIKNRYNQRAVEMLMIKYGCSKRFVQQCLAGERHSLTAGTICKEYDELVVKIENAICRAIDS